MKTFLYNVGYFHRETWRIVKSNLLSNLFSVLGTGLILFLFGMVATGTLIGNELLAKLQQEAEISAYFSETMDESVALLLVDEIKEIEGVWNARLVGEEESRSQMEDLLGEEAGILELFEENPFAAFIEIRIHLDSMDTVLNEVDNLNGIEYVRDNRAVLERLQGIIGGLKIIGTLIILAVGITTLIILSHMIRQGIYNNREQINTLRLLGAPGSFIGFPFVMVGLLLTLLGGALATILINVLINSGYSSIDGALTFIPLPSQQGLMMNISILIIAVSLVLGLLGSLFGLSSIGKNR
ncbi:MAG: hypothetical protein GX359_00030 [Clostridiales bacterium]|nr:hypothetical protein [Clostridiales bacterium]